MAAMLGSVSSLKSERDPPQHQRIAGALRHPWLENEPILVQRKHQKSTTKNIIKVKSTLKQMICRCCHIHRQHSLQV